MVEVPLGGGTSDAPEHSGIKIKFAIAAELREDVNTNEPQATDAVHRATESANAPRPTPQIVGQVGSVIDTGTKVATELQAFENPWHVLMQRVALLDKIVIRVAEVSGVEHLSPSLSEYRIDSPMRVVGLVCDDVRGPGLCVARHSH